MILDLFRKGQQELQRRHAEEEATKVGILRGGSVGLAFEPNKRGETDYAGGCAAQAYLRYRGINTSDLEQGTSTRELMFEAGRTNEDSWLAVLKASGYEGQIKCEEEVPVRYHLDNGTLVTGRPDIVLMDEKGEKPVRGIELKLVSSIWTARTVLIAKTPKLSHVTQAAHYAWRLAEQHGLAEPLPFELWYTNRADFETKADFSLEAYPRYGEAGSHHFAYRFYQVVADPDSGRFVRRAVDEKQYLLLREMGEEVEAIPAKYLPFIQGFHVIFRGDKVYYRDALNDKAPLVETIITKERIKRFYNLVSSLKLVPKEPITLKVDGKKENFKLSTYCSLGRLCCKNQAGRDILDWATEVAGHVEQELALRELMKGKKK